MNPFSLPILSSQPEGNHTNTPPPPYESVVDSNSEQRFAAGPKDFDIVVSDPVKQGDGVTAYVSYKVRTSAALEQYKKPGSSLPAVTEVIRRFRDFSWLHDRLVEKNKGVIVPPLPEKNAVQKFQMSTDFIEQRRRALQSFINRVAGHPVLKLTKELQMFLQANETEWNHEIAVAQAETVTKISLNTAMSWFKDVSHTATSLVSGRNDDALEDPEYLKIKEYIINLEAHLLEAHRQAQRLIRKEQELGAAVAEFGQSAERLGKFEEGSLPDAFVHLGARANQLAGITRDRMELLVNNFEAPLKEFARLVKSVQTTINDRSAALSGLQLAKSELDGKKVKLNKLRATPGTKEEKIAEAERELNDAEQAVKHAKLAYETIVDRMTEELNRFQRERASEMTTVLRAFALTQAQMANESAKTWGQLLLDLQGNLPQ